MMRSNVQFSLLTAATALGAITIVACSAGDPGSAAKGTADLGQATTPTYVPAGCSVKQDVPHPAVCFALRRTDAIPHAVSKDSTPSGFGPSDLASAYNIPSGGGSGLTVAIIDAQDDPNAESDLAVYRSQFGLPACTTANGCFSKVNQSGQASPLPTADSGWGGEISLDLDMVSAACPACNILLVEASSADNADLGAAVNTAASLGAVAISNSYGGAEDDTVAGADTSYYSNHPGILVTASAGDSAFGASFPATGSNVLAVAGTSLASSSNARGWSETVWNDTADGNGATGSGCSAFITKPSWQTDQGCSFRMEADVSAVADPETGVAVYDTYGGASAGASGWEVYGGTSASSPLVAAILTTIGQATSYGPQQVWQAAGSGFNDVTSGNNGTCSVSYECTAGVGYDGPSGWGTPDAVSISGGGGAGGGGTTPPTDAGAPPTDAGSGDSCSHDVCSTGASLTKSCDPCAGQVCDNDSYCCTTTWDDICVNEVSEYCAESCD